MQMRAVVIYFTAKFQYFYLAINVIRVRYYQIRIVNIVKQFMNY